MTTTCLSIYLGTVLVQVELWAGGSNGILGQEEEEEEWVGQSYGISPECL